MDRIFTPIILQGLPQHPELDEDFPCAVLHGYGLVLKSNIPTSIPHDITAFIWKNATMREKQLERYFSDTFGIEGDLVRQAIAVADDVDAAFRETLRKRAAAVIRQVEAKNQFALVLSMRPYQNDPLVNHHIGKYFTRLGVPVIPADALPGLEEVALDDIEVRVHSNIQATLYSAAKIVAGHPHLEFAHISSFGCGHEAVLTDELDRIIRGKGKQILLLKLDESDVRGPLRIRITSFVDTVRQRRLAPLDLPVTTPRVPPVFSKHDARLRTIYIPNLSVGFATMMSAVMESRGFRIRVLPLADERAIELGKLHLHNDICFPAQINVGEFLRMLEADAPDVSKIAFGMHQNCKDCRAGQYAMLARKALDAAGYENIPIVTSGDELRELHPGFKIDARMQLKILLGLAVLDALEDLRRSTRPYEIRAGSAELAYQEGMQRLCRALPRGRKRTLQALAETVDAFNLIPVRDEPRKPVVMILGEILLAVHPSANYQLEAYLEAHGMEVLGTRLSDFFHKRFVKQAAEVEQYFDDRSFLLTLVDKALDGMFERTRNAVEGVLEHYKRYRPRVSAHDLYGTVASKIEAVHWAGEGWLIPGEIMHAAGHGIHSFVIVQPFGCMPNHIFGRGVTRMVKDAYPDIQILSLDFDPDTSMGNIENRLQMLIMNARELEKLRHPGRVASTA